MIDLVSNYWIEFLCGIVAAGLGATARYFYKLYKNEKERKAASEHKDTVDEIKQLLLEEHENTAKLLQEEREKSFKDDSYIENKLEVLSEETIALKRGMLSLQGNLFKQKCRTLLDNSHVITLDEYEEIELDHTAYNTLGGNHTGDQLFSLVTDKFKNSLTHK